MYIVYLNILPTYMKKKTSLVKKLTKKKLTNAECVRSQTNCLHKKKHLSCLQKQMRRKKEHFSLSYQFL